MSFRLLKSVGLSVGICVGLFLSFSGNSYAETCGEQCSTRGGGSDIPSPLTLNQKVELAEGEHYVLVGRIQVIHEEAFFEVDFREHPWLANAKRAANPRYLLESISGYWKQFENRNLKLTVEARGTIVMRGANPPEYVIWLHSLNEPVDFSRDPSVEHTFPRFKTMKQ